MKSVVSRQKFTTLYAKQSTETSEQVTKYNILKSYILVLLSACQKY